MTIVEMGEKIAKEIDDKIEGNVISAVVYGSDIRGEPDENLDHNMVLVLDHVGMKELIQIRSVMNENMYEWMKTPLIVELMEIEGMGDSVPSSFLDVLSSYQTVYGKSLFKGLNAINHEHLRAQIEQRLRESLFSARRALLRGMVGGKVLDQELILIRNLMKRGLNLYLILKKPWLTEESEKWNSFIEEFSPDDMMLRNFFNKPLEQMNDEEKRSLSSSILDNGLKPLLSKVDEMGPK
jgi:hypothetical protein